MKDFDLRKYLAENKLLKEEHTSIDLFKKFKEEDILDDRREYDVEDLMSSYPGLSKEEAKKLFGMLQNIDENKLLKEDELPIEGELIGNEYIIDFDDLGNLWEKRFYEKYGYWHYQSDTEDDENYERYDNIQKETWKEIEDILSVKFGKPIKIKLDR